MRQIVTLNDAYKQTFRFSIEGYDAVEIALEFKPLQYAWFMNLTWGEFSLYGERVAVSPNLLRQFSHLLPFGILITGVDAIDPFANDSWLNGWGFYMLDETDMADIEALYVR
jgi:hypothetical protein